MKRTRKPATKPVAALPRRSARYASQPFCPNPFDADAIAEHSDAVRSAPHLASLGLPAVAVPKPGFRILCVMPDLETPHKVWEHFAAQADDLSDVLVDATDEAEKAAYEAEQAARRRRDIAADFNLQLRVMKLAETPGFTVDIVAERECAVLDVYELRLADRFVDPATYDVIFIDADDRQARALERCGAKRVVLVGDCKNQPHAIAPTLTALYGVIADELMLQRRQLRFDWAAPELPLPVTGVDDAAVDERILALSGGLS